jgi:hypothetical protein
MRHLQNKYTQKEKRFMKTRTTGICLLMLFMALTLFGCKKPDSRSPSPEKSGKLETVISFGSSGNARDYSPSGWSTPEKDFTWIAGKEGASLAIPIPSFKGEALTLSAKMFPHIIPGKLNKQTVEILINGQKAGKWEFTKPGNAEKTLLIPKTLITNRNLVISFITPDAAKPKDIGGIDKRILSVAFYNLKIAEK